MNKNLIVAVALIFMAVGPGACGETISVGGMSSGIAGDGGTNSLMVSWAAPTTNDDEGNTPLTDLAGYRIHYGKVSGDYYYVADVGNHTTAEIGGLSDGTWYAAVTAYDYFGNESDYSNEATFTFH